MRLGITIIHCIFAQKINILLVIRHGMLTRVMDLRFLKQLLTLYCKHAELKCITQNCLIQVFHTGIILFR